LWYDGSNRNIAVLWPMAALVQGIFHLARYRCSFFVVEGRSLQERIRFAILLPWFSHGNKAQKQGCAQGQNDPALSHS
jgi:hypothetical protein